MKTFVVRPSAIAMVALVIAAVTFLSIAGAARHAQVAWAVLCVLAASIAVHDLATMLIPDRHILGIFLVGIAEWSFVSGQIEALILHASAALLLAAALWLLDVLYEYLRGQTGLGMGDIKLLGASAVLLGIQGAGVQILLASLAALVFVLLRMMRLGRPLRAATRIPFGTFLAPALVIVWAWLQTGW